MESKLKKNTSVLVFIGSLIVYFIFFKFSLPIPEYYYLDIILVVIVTIICLRVKAKFKIYKPHISLIASGIVWSSYLILIYFSYVMIDLLINYPK